MNIYIGWDSREVDAYNACVNSIYRNLYNNAFEINVIPIMQNTVRAQGLYQRDPNESASTEFAFTRFLVPRLHNSYYASLQSGDHHWSLFCDCDFIFTTDIRELLKLTKEKYAVMVVKHDYIPKSDIKMDGQKQVSYPRKNWSSLILWNSASYKNKRLLNVNQLTAAELHRFKWLDDNEIGELPLEWNWLVGEYDKLDKTPKGIHYTNGGPWFDNYKDVDYADLWNQYKT